MLPTVSRRYFAPALNLWYRAVAKPQAATSNSASWCVQVGITERGLDDLGDVTSVLQIHALNNNKKDNTSNNHIGDELKQNPSAIVVAGQDLIRIHWEGYAQTSADELYHTVWETIEGAQTIPSPVSGQIEHIVDNVDQEEVDEETVLVELSCDEASLQQAAIGWIEEKEYLDFIQKQSRGKFADSVER
jgi:glycine cleavage system H lipoate-binding protein